MLGKGGVVGVEEERLDAGPFDKTIPFLSERERAMFQLLRSGAKSNRVNVRNDVGDGGR